MDRQIRPLAVAVAADVLANLDALKVRTGSYFKWLGPCYFAPAGGAPLATHVTKVRASCEVCLLGACVLSKAALIGGVDVGSVLPSSSLGIDRMRHVAEVVCEALDDVFDARTLTLMEVAFERRMCLPLPRVQLAREDLRAAMNFGDRHAALGGPRRVVRAVMENVIANDGYFEPSPFPTKEENEPCKSKTPAPPPSTP